jgi:hypothetical protein
MAKKAQVLVQRQELPQGVLLAPYRIDLELPNKYIEMALDIDGLQRALTMARELRIARLLNARPTASHRLVKRLVEKFKIDPQTAIEMIEQYLAAEEEAIQSEMIILALFDGNFLLVENSGVKTIIFKQHVPKVEVAADYWTSRKDWETLLDNSSDLVPPPRRIPQVIAEQKVALLNALIKRYPVISQGIQAALSEENQARINNFIDQMLDAQEEGETDDAGFHAGDVDRVPPPGPDADH